MWGRLRHQLLERLGITRLSGDVSSLADGLESLGTDAAAVDVRLAAVDDRLERIETSLYLLRSESLEHWPRVLAATEWGAHAPLRHEPTISVILPTRNRADLVTRAIESVLAQTYPNWELVIVDDGSSDATPGVLDRHEDPRIVRHRADGVGAPSARNLGLELATGDWVTFVDDDNVMHPGWLRAIAEVTGREVGAAAVHGAQLRDDAVELVPWLLYAPDRTLDDLRRDNSIDLGMLAVRRDHPDLRFDPDLDLYEDWDLVVRLWQHDPVRPFGALSGCYSTAAPGRVTQAHDETTLNAMRRRLGAR